MIDIESAEVPEDIFDLLVAQGYAGRSPSSRGKNEARHRLRFLMGSVQHSTRLAYWAAIRRFLVYTKQRPEVLLECTMGKERLDVIVMDYLIFAHENDLCFTPASTRASIQCIFGLPRGALSGSARVQSTIESLRKRTRTLPITMTVLLQVLGKLDPTGPDGLPGESVVLEERQFVASSLIALYALVARPGELWSLKRNDLKFQDDGSLRVSLTVTKNRRALKRAGLLKPGQHSFEIAIKGRIEVHAFRTIASQAKESGDLFWPARIRRIRKEFADAATAIGLGKVAEENSAVVRLHGLRVGAVTDLALAGSTVAERQAAGRWTTSSSPLFYSNVTLARIAHALFPGPRLGRHVAWLGSLSPNTSTEPVMPGEDDVPAGNDEDSEQSEEMFDVERIRAAQMHERRVIVEVKWVGYTGFTWHPAVELKCTEAFHTFKESSKGQAFNKKHNGILDTL